MIQPSSVGNPISAIFEGFKLDSAELRQFLSAHKQGIWLNKTTAVVGLVATVVVLVVLLVWSEVFD